MSNPVIRATFKKSFVREVPGGTLEYHSGNDYFIEAEFLATLPDDVAFDSANPPAAPVEEVVPVPTTTTEQEAN